MMKAFSLQQQKYTVIQYPKSQKQMINQQASGKYQMIDGDKLVQGTFSNGQRYGRWVYYDQFGNTAAYRYCQERVGAICNDGSRSYATGRGACSRHGGVSQWLYDTIERKDDQYYSNEQQKYTKTKNDAMQIYGIKNENERQALYTFFKKAIKIHKTNEIYQNTYRILSQKVNKISTTSNQSRQKQKLELQQKIILSKQQEIQQLQQKCKELEKKLKIFEQDKIKLAEQLVKQQQRNNTMIYKIQRIFNSLSSELQQNKNQIPKNQVNHGNNKVIQQNLIVTKDEDQYSCFSIQPQSKLLQSTQEIEAIAIVSSGLMNK